MLRLDHILMAVRDLSAAAAALADDHGLASLPGGRHPGFGTVDRIVPLGGPYLELIAVADEDEAAASPLGRAVAARAERGGGLFAWCLAADDIAREAAARGLDAVPGRRIRPDGAVVSWRLAGLERALADPELPFLIGWDDGVPHPGAAEAHHRVRPHGVLSLEVGTRDPATLRAWAAGLDVDVVPVDGPPGPHRLVVATGDAPLVIP